MWNLFIENVLWSTGSVWIIWDSGPQSMLCKPIQVCFHAVTLHVTPPFLWYQESRCHDLGFPCASSDCNKFPRRIHKQTWNSDAYVIRAAQSQYTWVFHCLASVHSVVSRRDASRLMYSEIIFVGCSTRSETFLSLWLMYASKCTKNISVFLHVFELLVCHSDFLFWLSNRICCIVAFS